MSRALALVLLCGCTPHLYSPADTGDTAWDWQAPENGWPVQEPPRGLQGQGWEEGQVVPDFLLVDQHGDLVSLWQFYGMVVVIDHSTLWCVSCQELARGVEETWQTYREQGFMYLTLLSQDMEGQVPDVDELTMWADYGGITAPILADDAGIADQVVGAEGFPRLQVVDRSMRMAVDQVTPASDAQLRVEVEALL